MYSVAHKQANTRAFENTRALHAHRRDPGYQPSLRPGGGTRELGARCNVVQPAHHSQIEKGRKLSTTGLFYGDEICVTWKGVYDNADHSSPRKMMLPFAHSRHCGVASYNINMR